MKITNTKKLYSCINEIVNNVPAKFWGQESVAKYLSRRCDLDLAYPKVKTRFNNLAGFVLQGAPNAVVSGRNRGAEFKKERLNYASFMAPAINPGNPGKSFVKVKIKYDDGTSAEGVAGNIAILNLYNTGFVPVINAPAKIIRNLLCKVWDINDPMERIRSYDYHFFKQNEFTYRITPQYACCYSDHLFRDPSIQVGYAYNEMQVRKYITAINDQLASRPSIYSYRSRYSIYKEAINEDRGCIACCVCFTPDVLTEFANKNMGEFYTEARKWENTITDIINSYS